MVSDDRCSLMEPDLSWIVKACQQEILSMGKADEFFAFIVVTFQFTTQTVGCRKEALLMKFDQVDPKALNEMIVDFRERIKPRAEL